MRTRSRSRDASRWSGFYYLFIIIIFYLFILLVIGMLDYILLIYTRKLESSILTPEYKRPIFFFKPSKHSLVTYFVFLWNSSASRTTPVACSSCDRHRNGRWDRQTDRETDRHRVRLKVHAVKLDTVNPWQWRDRRKSVLIAECWHRVRMENPSVNVLLIKEGSWFRGYL